MCKISVLMPVYNAEKYLNGAIDSILSQTYSDFEFVIIDDCSSDSSVSIIESYADERIVFLKNEHNSGVAVTLNRGLQMCHGEYIARMDSDDISHPERFEKQLAFLQAHPDVAVVTCGVRTFCGDKTISESGWTSVEPEKIKKDLFFSCALAHPTVMMRRSVINEVGGYAPEYNGLEDYELWCRVIEKHKIASVGEILFEYRIHEGQVSKKPPESVKNAQKELKKRQLEQIGAVLSENELNTFLSFATGDLDCTDEEIDYLHKAFCKISESNRKALFYDADLFDADLRTVLLGKSTKKQRKEIFKNSVLLSSSYIRKYEIKELIKKILKR